MTLTILVPLDGTPFSEAALPAAAKIAEDAHARLLLFEAIPPAEKSSRTDQEEAAARASALDYLHQVQRRVVRQYGVEQVYIETEPCRPADGIGTAAFKWGASLIVMATHGRRLLHESVAECVLRQGLVPVALVRPQKAE